MGAEWRHLMNTIGRYMRDEGMALSNYSNQLLHKSKMFRYVHYFQPGFNFVTTPFHYILSHPHFLSIYQQ